MNWETVIGLEVHVQLDTASKLFCACSTSFGVAPNTNVCPVCLGLPGALPVLNSRAVELGVNAALAFGCDIAPTSVFARKSYFYPDLPKGYQISQFSEPLAEGGSLTIMSDKRGSVEIGITRLHLEEDAGKSMHDRFPSATAIDLNRAGVPLAEIVSEPDIRAASEARAYLVHLKRIMQYLKVSDCKMEEGSLRVDANISVRRPGEELGTKQEIKNLNSFAAVERSLTRLAERQVASLEAGGPINQATFTVDGDQVVQLRVKEGSTDYRYFPDPDLPPLLISADLVTGVRNGLPELPMARKARFERQFGLSAYDAEVLTGSSSIADLFEQTGTLCEAPPKNVANWIMNEVLSVWKDGPVPPVKAEALATVIDMVRNEELNRAGAKKILIRLADNDCNQPPRGLAQTMDLLLESDERRLDEWVATVVREQPDEIERVRGGETRLVDFLVGKVMKASRGKADPAKARALLLDS
jgi:aspartyl-tRNA(Asn)/glutamyl-tRNA(Gln) amidotransferase subunit B